MAMVEVYTSANCSFCERAKTLLSNKGVAFTEHRIDQDPAALDAMLSRAQGRRSVPQIFINDQPIGGFDALWALQQSGELDQRLAE